VDTLDSPADRYAAAKKRVSHPLTIEFIEQFDFGFDDFQIAACRSSGSANWCR
jgi:ATP-dependent RNA helicase HelY